MAYFTQDFIDFFLELAQNNEKAWFDENRKRYEKNIKEPFRSFVDEMIMRVHAEDPEVMIEAKDAIFRINRDIRFSKNKNPYKTQVSAIVSPGGKKDKTVPGLYFELNAHEVRVYGGSYMLDKEQLYRVRMAIMNHLDHFATLLEAPEFKESYGELHGDKHKRIAPEFKEAAVKQPLLFNKQFYYYTTMDSKHITQEGLGDKIMKHYLAGQPVSHFLRQAIYGY